MTEPIKRQQLNGVWLPEDLLGALRTEAIRTSGAVVDKSAVLERILRAHYGSPEASRYITEHLEQESAGREAREKVRKWWDAQQQRGSAS